MIRVHVNVSLKSDVMDPQGNAVGRALETLGYPQVRQVRVGRCFDLRMEGSDLEAAREQVEKMCEQLLANTVIEKYDIQMEAE